MKIEEIMTRPAASCRRDDMLSQAAQLMWEHDCGIVPVTEDGDRVIGMVTDRDICMATYIQGRPPQHIPVADIMSHQVFSCRTDDPLEAAERLMSDKQIRRVPVTDGDNRLVGILSLNDLARYAASARKKNGLEREVTQTLAAICQPRARPAEESTEQSASAGAAPPM
jgi:CBS domain-containing protein